MTVIISKDEWEAYFRNAGMSPVTQADIDRHLMKRQRPSGPLIVAFYGGPGTGKSTMATGVFHNLKLRGCNVEYVHEHAKDLTWEQRWTALGVQAHVAGEQMLKYDRLRGKVDAIITDTSTLLGILYHPKDMPGGEYFDKWLMEDWRARRTMDIFLTRSTRPYQPHGRRQNEDSAREIDERTKKLLLRAVGTFTTFPSDESSVVPISDMVERAL